MKYNDFILTYVVLALAAKYNGEGLLIWHNSKANYKYRKPADLLVCHLNIINLKEHGTNKDSCKLSGSLH